MSDIKENFVWNDKLVMEFAYRFVDENKEYTGSKLEAFKKSKEKDIPNSWDRTEHEAKCGYQILSGAMSPSRPTYISSVKRLKDNEIFNIGDEVYITNNKGERFGFIISKFEEEPNYNLMATAKGTSCRWHISLLKKDIPKDWEIVSFIYKNGTIDNIEDRPVNALWYKNDPNWKIHAVKRLSDGEVFTIGDKVLWLPNDITTITEFRLIDGELAIYGEGFGIPLENISKVKPKVPLFTTEDGVGIHAGDSFWYKGDDWVAKKTFVLNNEIWNKKLPAFSTKQLCEDYILLNKPVQVSYKELKDYVEKHQSESNCDIRTYKTKWEVVADLFKQKINP